ncbi:DUF4974 domain-containing protein [Mucilaginibacter corticis]|uniref:DUF4974 domain-containing protein n=1 Tax=Mucilaginibacter corticis TaxID=2597670 RepID=A0A556ML65_9SPHI|nr:FecR family protein [Mucilaginibacter corticis]TSJ40529.1 DUF4974 domain-containing protein [Mucilaginibacter corticis]
MQQHEANVLWTKFLAGQCTDEERLLVESWFHHLNIDEEIDLSESEIDTSHQKMWEAVRPVEAKIKPLWHRIAIAASVIICLSFAAIYYLHKPGPQKQMVYNKPQDLLPGGNKAILTLSNGKKIVLNNIKNGNVAVQAGAQIVKTQNGQLVYSLNNTNPGLPAESAGSLTYNTITTPRGGQWQLTLPDGSRVWLNAASSITFPAMFSGQNRNVKITGEVYFEVVHNAAKPFNVTVGGLTIEDLGTHFNINAYDDEGSIKTTLLEGSVKVSSRAASTTLIPGQQSSVDQNSDKIYVKNADVDEAISWKNGLFQFDRADIKTVMREFARWYDVNVQYSGKIPVRAFSGSIDRNTKASVALQILSIQGVHFQIKDKQIIVLP